MLLKRERDSGIQKFFNTHNLGALPEPPFSTAVADTLIDRVKSGLIVLEKDLNDKKVFTLMTRTIVFYFLFSYACSYCCHCFFKI